MHALYGQGTAGDTLGYVIYVYTLDLKKMRWIVAPFYDVDGFNVDLID